MIKGGVICGRSSLKLVEGGVVGDRPRAAMSCVTELWQLLYATRCLTALRGCSQCQEWIPGQTTIDCTCKSVQF